MASTNNIKCVVVGDDTIAQLQMIFRYSMGYDLPENTQHYPPPFRSSFSVDGMQTELEIWHTSNSDDHDFLRPLTYYFTGVFIIIFMVDSPPSFERVSSKWIPEIRRFCPETPYVLVGVGTEARENNEIKEKLLKNYDRGCITKEEGARKAEEIGARAYLECSARKNQGLKEVFEGAARAAIIHMTMMLNQTENV